ncbi:MAG: leucine-rich repeat protein, partial [Paludibacteraceae bacterium]|nr:leucine-rich repeat protein [Paludibacteraceae bacterium]
NINLPDTLTHIGERAFRNCGMLKEIELPGTPSICDRTFENCASLESVVLKSGVTEIGKQAFCDCEKLTSVSFPNTVKTIHSEAFRNCASLTVPSFDRNVSVKKDAFWGCGKKKPTIDATDFRALVEGKKVVVSGKFYNIKRQILECVVEWCGGKLAKSVTKGTNYMIAGEDVGPTKLHKCYELGVSLVSEDKVLELLRNITIKMPDTIAEIEDNAFEKCNGLARIILPNTLTKIGERAFLFCEDLKYVYIPASVTEIGTAPFSGCDNIECIELDPANSVYRSGDGVIIKGDTALFGTPGYKGTVTLPNTVRKLGKYCFFQNQLKQIVLPDSLTELEYLSLSSCKNLTEIVLPASLKSIGADSMSSLVIKELTIPEGVTDIGKAAFSFNKFEKVVLPSTLKTIAYSAFQLCSNLKEVVIPETFDTEGFGFSEQVKITRR